MRTRRVTARQLMRRLRADVILDDRLSNPRALPLGARPVLEVVAELVAASPEPGVYRPDPELDGPLCEQIARRLHFHGGEAEVEGHFARLVRTGLLVVGEGDTIAWPVAVPNFARGGAGSGDGGPLSTRPLDTGGRPRRHETKEQARERRLVAQGSTRGGAQGHAQRSMTLVIPGGGSGGGAADHTANLAAETSSETPGVEVRFPGEVSALSAPETLAETAAETSSGGFEVSSRAAAAAVGTMKEINTREPNLAAAAAESRPAREAVAAEVCVGVSGEVSFEVCARVSAEVSPEVSPDAAPGVGREVALIVAEAARLHGIAETEQARLTAHSWLLERGLTVEGALEMLRREGKRAPGAAPIRVLHWFDCKVAHYLAKQRQAAVPAAADGGGTAPAPLHPGIAVRPEWARQPAQRQSWLKAALEGWGLAGSDRRRKLKFVYDLDKEAWALFAATYPEAWEVIGVEPPRASP
jgi:hypothetical protein